ncbi:nitroreductase family protein [Lapillicoccus sp.]|uniref:nitroreductase family protein n=1 Tax=Lapillicoccus sp. TaxID=1909287 RepID=UPI0025ED39EC|nr:nitroreductase family protein [Lapillicoccus sp.]
MEFSEVVRRRRMVRRYDPDRPVPDAVLAACLDNAVRAPSAGFSQGWDFVVLRSHEERGAFWTATAEDADATPDAWLAGMQSAPVVILALSHKQAYLERYADPDKGWTDRDEARWPVPYWDIDTGMASLLMLLTATDAGLGSLFFGVPPECHDDVHRAFAIPHDRTIIGAIALGYAVPGPKSPSLRRHRRTGAEVAHWGRFGQER